MFTTLSLRNRLLWAAALVLGLAAVGLLGRMPGAEAARWGLGLMLLMGLAMGWMRRKSSGPRFLPPERLRVVSRAGLSPRCGLALVEVDGKSFLVAFGDSFAEVHETPAAEGERSASRSGMAGRGASAVPGGSLQ
jgi:flagellar protein FliO/FliZ